jgi:hypothetical protein
MKKEWFRMLFWMAHISASAPNCSLHLFLLLDIKPCLPSCVATVYHIHMIEVFEKNKNKKCFGLTKIIFQQLTTVVNVPVNNLVTRSTCSFRHIFLSTVLQIYSLSSKCPCIAIPSTKNCEYWLYQCIKSMNYIVVCCVCCLLDAFGHFECCF